MSVAPRDDLGDDPLEALRRLEMFRGLTGSEAEQLAAAATVVRVPQDRVLPRGGDAGEAPAHYFLLRGQVAFAEFDVGKVPKGPPNPKKRATPVMQVARRVVSLFDVGDFFSNEHVASARTDDGERRDVALFTCVGIVALKLDRAALDAALAALPAVREAVEIKAEESYYRQSLLKLDGRAEALDLYVKQGFEYASAIKVIQTDKCIDCDECVRACEDRHGVSRIERFGPRFGLIQFTLNCRSCEDARCIDVCNFDAIGYDAQREVIVYDNCVGCTLCAKACPHEAIRMVDIKDEPEAVDLVGLVKKQQAGDRPLTMIARGEEDRAPKKKKAKRIANKCDHCHGYQDMACITACPTAAIIQIDPRALFRRDGGLIERADRYFDPAPFERGWAATTRAQGVLAMQALFAVAALAVLACAWEWLARKSHPDLSLWRAALSLVDGAEAARQVALGFTPVRGLGRWLGYAGAAMMTVSALYTLRLHLPGLRRIGSSRTWFDFHVVFGLAGPALSLLHTDLAVFDLLGRPLVTTLWWSVAAIVASGLVGRFLYTAIPSLEATSERERQKLDEGIQRVADQWSSMTVSANVMAQFLKAREKSAPPGEAEPGAGFLWFLLRSELERLRASWALRFRTMGGMKNRELRATTLALMSRRASIERRMRLYGAARKLLTRWRGIHIGLSILMFVLLAVHVAVSVYAVGW